MGNGERGLGAILLAVAAARFADHLGIKGIDFYLITIFVGLGSVLLATGRFTGW